ncbi:MAG: hypothetical protein QM762_17825 [Chryseolinea sp.]
MTRRGGITGKLYPFGELNSISCDLSGLYIKNNDRTEIGVTCDFSDPNLDGCTQLLFLGEIINYNVDRECLILKWLAEHNLLWSKVCNRDFEILLGCKFEDERNELIKVRDYLTEYPLLYFC